MINCQICGTPNRDTSQYCDECGAPLIVRSNNSEVAASVETNSAAAPVFQPSNATSVGIPNIAQVIAEAENQSAEFEKERPGGVHATLVIERGEAAGAEFQLTANEFLIGRWDADNGIFPDADLDRCDPEAKISRRHARILHSDGQYSIEDLGSTNGTYLNRGRRLIPGSAQSLKDGDEIIVGKTFLRFSISQ